MSELAQISLLQNAYRKLSGFDLRLRGVCSPYENWWHQFIQEGFTVQDLETVLLYLKTEIREQRRNPGSLKLSNLISDLSRFDEELQLAKGVLRNRKPAPDAKERVQQAWHPTVPEPVNVGSEAKPLGQLIPKLIAEMRKAIE